MLLFLPVQSVFACIVAIFIRGNLLLCITLQFYPRPSPRRCIYPPYYFVGEVARGRSPAKVWHEVTDSTAEVFTGDSLVPYTRFLYVREESIS